MLIYQAIAYMGCYIVTGVVHDATFSSLNPLSAFAVEERVIIPSLMIRQLITNLYRPECVFQFAATREGEIALSPFTECEGSFRFPLLSECKTSEHPPRRRGRR